MIEKSRLDVYLVNMGLASSRNHAQDLIDSGQVYLIENGGRKMLKKASLLVSSHIQIEVEKGPANKYVSRGGLKLEGALIHTRLSLKSWSVLDVGISTGGFADCLLQSGVDYVLGVDVGHGQVHSSLIQNKKLRIIERVNARELSQCVDVIEATPKNKFDLIVMDVSFISIGLIIPELPKFLKSGGYLLSLVKPQFEVGIDGLSKGGIVKNEALYEKVENKIKEVCALYGFQALDYFSSSITGKDGNHEFFILAKKD
jgi:23S rRNA (cytidine1920-2'-O)/16S rRNA (cytidine1409-2'-O)-methyltransferase